jgi:hypothetical protein
MYASHAYIFEKSGYNSIKIECCEVEWRMLTCTAKVTRWNSEEITFQMVHLHDRVLYNHTTPVYM